MYCSNGHGVPAGSQFCPMCGAPVLVTGGPPPAVQRTGFVVAVAATVGVLLIAGIVAAIVVLGSGADAGDGTARSATARSSRDSAADTATDTGTPTSTTTSTTIDPAVVEQQRRDAVQKELMLRLENLLNHSSQGRGRVGEVVGGVENCTIYPEQAESEIRGVITNRESVLNQIVGLDASGDAEVASAVAQLQEAIQASIDADYNYAEWMTFLYAEYYYLYPVGCAQAPRDSAYERATEDSHRASRAKQAFVNQYNALAQKHGMRTWSEGEI